MNRIFVDMDGVVVDFDKCAKGKCLTGDQLKRLPGAYLEMDPLPNAITGVRSLIGMGFEVWLATKPPTGIPFAYADKVQWVLDHLPEKQ
jgi:5'-nucleotidase